MKHQRKTLGPFGCLGVFWGERCSWGVFVGEEGGSWGGCGGEKRGGRCVRGVGGGCWGEGVFGREGGGGEEEGCSGEGERGCPEGGEGGVVQRGEEGFFRREGGVLQGGSGERGQEEAEPRQTEIKRQRRTLGAGQTIWSVFFGENLAEGPATFSQKHGLCPFRCLGVQVLWFRCLGVQVFKVFKVFMVFKVFRCLRCFGV